MNSDIPALWLQFAFDTQTSQQRLWYDVDMLSPADVEQLTKELLLGLHEEAAELQRVTDQSRYHLVKDREGVARSPASVAEAGVDVFKYLLALLTLHGVNAEAFAAEFNRKTDVVAQRWRWEMEALSGYTILFSDLDGCVADLTGSFTVWAREQSTEVAPERWYQAGDELRQKFYASGGYQRLSLVSGAIETLNAWRAESDMRRLILVTARPYRQHPRVYADTLAWCRSVGLNHDHILFTRDKADAVARCRPATVVGFIEDAAKYAIDIATSGTRVFLLPSPGEETISHPLIEPVSGWPEIREKLGR